MAENQSIEKILNIILRIVRTVLYIGWFIFLLLGTVWLVAMMAGSMATINDEPYTSDIYVEIHPEIFIYMFGAFFSSLQLETALVLLRKYSKALGILHIVLFAICFVATCVLLMLESMPKH